MIQEIIVGILFIGAVVYLISIFRKQAKAKNACGEVNCKCDSSTIKDKSNYKTDQKVKVS